MTDHKTRSISKNLTTSLVLVIAIISLVFISIYYFQVSRREEKRLENTAEEYIHSLASTLEVPLWDIDRENIITVCDYYIQNDLAVLIKLTGVSGEVFYLNKLEENIDEEALINRSTEIFHKGERLGTVQVSLSRHRSKEVKKELLKASIAAVLIVVVGLVFFTGFLLKKMLHEPMKFLGRIANEYSKGNYHPQLMNKPYKEFEPFVSVLYGMGETIESQMNDLQRAEKSLKKHRDELEKMVIQRTRELEISNRDLQNEIQDRKRAQEKLKANEQRLKAILRASPVGIGLVINRRLDWANVTMYQMVGYEKDSLLGKDARILYKDEKAYEQAGRKLYEGISESDIGHVETQWVRKDGSVFDCVIRAYSLDKSDPSMGQIVAVLDISEAKRLDYSAQLN
jgi:PAS domain S-box-containing protein